MPVETGAVVRRWAWVVVGATLFAVVVGTGVFFLTDESWPLAAGLALPWMATLAVHVLAGRGVPKWIRVYAWCGGVAALLTLALNPEGWSDRFLFALFTFIVPPLVFVYAFHLPVFDVFVSLYKAAGPVVTGIFLGGIFFACVGAVLVMPMVVLKRWADDAAVGHWIWITWAGSLALAVALAASGEGSAGVLLVPLASLVALAGLAAPLRFARETRWVQRA